MHELHRLGDLARDAGDAKRAAALHNEALSLRRQIGQAPGVVASLEAIGGLAAGGGHHGHAARLLGAARAIRERGGYARASWEAARYDADVELARRGLSAGDFEIAFDQGAEMSIEDAAAQASKGRGARQRPANGWEGLTKAERKVATLVAEGLTNRAIAERLFITPATVKNHLSHIFSKLSIARRSELAAEVWRRGQPRGE